MTATPKAPRPNFFDDPAIDRLTAIVTALGAEVAVLSERVRTLEAALADKGVLPQDAVDAHQPSPDQAQARRDRLEAFNQRVFYVLQEELDSLGEDA